MDIQPLLGFLTNYDNRQALLRSIGLRLRRKVKIENEVMEAAQKFMPPNWKGPEGKLNKRVEITCYPNGLFIHLDGRIDVFYGDHNNRTSRSVPAGILTDDWESYLQEYRISLEVMHRARAVHNIPYKEREALVASVRNMTYILDQENCVVSETEKERLRNEVNEMQPKIEALAEIVAEAGKLADKAQKAVSEMGF